MNIINKPKYAVVKELVNLSTNTQKPQYLSRLLKDLETDFLQELYPYCDNSDFESLEQCLRSFEAKNFVDLDYVFSCLLRRSDDVEFNLKLLKYIDVSVDLYDKSTFYKSLLYNYTYFGQNTLVEAILSTRDVDDFEYVDFCVDAFIQFFKNYELKIEFREYIEEHESKLLSVKHKMIEILLKNCGKFILADMQLLQNYFHKKAFNKILKLSHIINKLRDSLNVDFSTARYILSNVHLRDIFVCLYDDNKLSVLKSKQDVEEFVHVNA